MALQKDAEIIRELAKQYCELAALEVNQERRSRLRAVNDLKTGVRPGVWIDELPWHELNFDGSLTLRCEDDFARQMEQFFRRALFRWKYFQADMVLEGYGNELIRKVTDQKFGEGAADYAAEALRAYLNK